MGRPKRKCVYEHAQIAQIKIYPTHAQSLIRASCCYIVWRLMILLADS